MKRSLTSLAAALLAGTLTAASGVGYATQAQAAQPAQVVAVHYGDLDLGSSAGRSSLEQRIRHAVRTACGDASPADLRGQNAADACRADLTATLITQRDAVFASRGSGNTLLARR
jgi:UrcA family protein